MKVKQTNLAPKKLEKKNTKIFILDLYIQRQESFYIASTRNKFEFHQIYTNKDKIIIPIFYPRIKKTSFYNKAILKQIKNESILIISPNNKTVQNESNKDDDFNNDDVTSNLENSIFESTEEIYPIKVSENQKEKIIRN